MGKRAYGKEKERQLKLKMTGAEFCRRLERAKAEADWEFIDKFNVKIRKQLETHETYLNL